MLRVLRDYANVVAVVDWSSNWDRRCVRAFVNGSAIAIVAAAAPLRNEWIEIENCRHAENSLKNPLKAQICQVCRFGFVFIRI